VHYDWVPVVKRKPLVWPNGKRPGVIVTVDCELRDLLKDSTEPCYAGGPPMLPDPLPGNVAGSPDFTWPEYGLRVGVRRMCRVFEDAGVRISRTLNAKTALEPARDAAHPRHPGRARPGVLSRLHSRRATKRRPGTWRAAPRT
jgi:hypothetical protein